MQGWKRREWKHRHNFAGVENAVVETSGKIDTAECYVRACRERMVRLITREIIFEEFQRISSQSTNVTDGRTDGQLIMTIPRYATHQMGVVSSKIAIFASCGRYMYRNVIRDQNYNVSVAKWLFVDIEQMTK